MDKRCLKWISHQLGEYITDEQLTCDHSWEDLNSSIFCCKCELVGDSLADIELAKTSWEAGFNCGFKQKGLM